MTEPTESGPALSHTALHDLHMSLGARMGPFAGYEMPIRFPKGTISEHNHTRSKAGLFDVSHMGVIELHGPARAEALERLVPSAITTLREHRLRYTFLTNPTGGIIDDLIVRNDGDRLVIVANAARKDDDLAHLKRELSEAVEVRPRPDLAILALQGPGSAGALGAHLPDVSELTFMAGLTVELAGASTLVSRSGYTGEDGFELILPAARVEQVARLLLGDPAVEPAGLGARDTLRLEAGLCLYGEDLDESTTPVEADFVWAMQKRRRTEGGFLGYEVIRKQLDDGPSHIRVGIRPEGRAPVRGDSPLLDTAGNQIGRVTSGTFGPTVGGPVAMGYVDVDWSSRGATVHAVVRGREITCRVVELPFVPHRYFRGN